VPHRQREQVDHLIRMRAYQVGAQYEVGFLLNQDLESVHRLGGLPGDEPVRRLLALDPKLEAFLARLRRTEADLTGFFGPV
jgi:hypothetical protein